MATYNEKRKGWEWNREEREARQSPARKFRNLYFKKQEQVSRVESCMPTFAVKAKDAFAQLSGAARSVIDLDLSARGRKYKPISPEQFDQVIEQLPQLMQPWVDFTSSPDYLAALKAVNKEICARNRLVRKHNQAVRAQNAAVYAKMRSVITKIEDGDLGAAFEEAAKQNLL